MALKILSSRRATWLWADFLYFFFYVGMTFVIALAIGSMPDRILNSVLQKGNLEYTTNNDRIDTILAYQDPFSGRFDYAAIESDGVINNETVRNLLAFPKDRKLALLISLDGKSAFRNKNYYEIAKPLTPITYESIVSKSEVYDMKAKAWKVLTIEQVYKPT